MNKDGARQLNCPGCDSDNIIEGFIERRCRDCNEQWYTGVPECPQCKCQIIRLGVCVRCKLSNVSVADESAGKAISEVINGLLPRIKCYEGEDGYVDPEEKLPENLVKSLPSPSNAAVSEVKPNLMEIFNSNRNEYRSKLDQLAEPLIKLINRLAEIRLKGTEITDVYYQHQANEFAKKNAENLIFIHSPDNGGWKF